MAFVLSYPNFQKKNSKIGLFQAEKSVFWKFGRANSVQSTWDHFKSIKWSKIRQETCRLHTQGIEQIKPVTAQTNGAFLFDQPSTGHVTTQKTVFGHNSTELHFYPVMGGDSESASKNTSDSTILIPIYSNLKNLNFLLASDLVLAALLLFQELK